MKEHRISLDWGCYGRIDRIDEELLVVMRDAGCTGVYYGIEGGTDAVLEKIKKGFDIGTAMEKLVISKKYFRNVTASFIWGYPFEQYTDFLQTLTAIKGLQQKGITTQLHQLCAVRDTDIYREYRDTVSFSKNNPFSSVVKPLAIEPEAYRRFVEAHADIFLAYSAFATPDEEKKTVLLSRFTRFPL